MITRTMLLVLLLAPVASPARAQPPAGPAAQPQRPPGYGPPPPAAGTPQQPPAYGQGSSQAQQPPAYAAPPPPPAEPSRSGFTFGLSLGLGYIIAAPDSGDSASAAGLGGLNFEIGGFFSPSFALVFKISGATVSDGGVRMTSGIAAVAAQFWAGIFKLEAGVGGHFIDVGAGGLSFGGNQAFGIYLGPAVQVAELGAGQSLQLGAEWTTGFYDGGLIHTLGLVFGWQSL